ncbi:MAG: S26 family signal peptidase, partial [Flavobacteriales bacterium]|nr:S26 family signal peptidase [Flavobacteriales bacterium]
FQNQSYYQLVRDHGRAKIQDPNTMLPNVVDGEQRLMPTGGILVRPLDKREHYIKRCVGTAGDTLEVRSGYVYVNGKKEDLPEKAQFGYETVLKTALNERALDMLKKNYDVALGDLGNGQGPEAGSLNVALTGEQVAELEKGNPFFGSLTRQDQPRGYTPPGHKWPYFPNHPDYTDWSVDNFGPIWIPKEGATVQLTLANLPLYERIIKLYEHNDLQVKDGTILINGSPATSYTFQQDYYWMMGDNRHRSQDSRYWGFVPHDHVVGKAVLVWFTKDPYTGIRWKRLFTLVD